MLYGLSQYATGSSLPVGSWIVPMWGAMGQNAQQCQAMTAFMSSPLFYLGIIFYVLTWILILATLVALFRYLWRRAGHY